MTSPLRFPAALEAAGDPDVADRVMAAWARERPELDASSIAVVTRIWRLARHLERERELMLESVDIDRMTLEILASLRRAGRPFRRTAGELQRTTMLSSGGISQRLDKLERAGLVARHMHPDDRRRVEVELTLEGMELVDRVVDALMTHDSAVLEMFDASERSELAVLLKRFLQRFE